MTAELPDELPAGLPDELPDELELLLLARPRRPVFVISAPPSVRVCGRALAVRSFLDWLEQPGAPDLALPGRPIMIELSPKAALPDGATGRFVIAGRGGWAVNELRVVVAIGRSRNEDPAAFEARLATVPHELAHVAQWYALYGDRTPWEVLHDDARANRSDLPSLAPWRELAVHEGGEASPEAIGRAIVHRYFDEHPERARPVCPPHCACRTHHG